jgi:hypothetical protein
LISKILISILATLIFAASAAAAGPQYITYEGYIETLAGVPVTTATQFKFQIADHNGTCVLYEETQTLTPQNGHFTAKIGTGGPGARTIPASAPTFSNLFSNQSLISGKLYTNTALTCNYTPVAGDSRQLFAYINDGGFVSAGSFYLGSTPNALNSDNSERVGNLLPSDLLQVNTSTASLSQSNLESIFSLTNFSRLSTLVSVPPTNYVQTGSNGSLGLPTVAGNPPIGLAAGQLWYDSSSNVLKYYDGTIKTLGTSAGTVTNVSGSSPINVTLATSTPVISITSANSTTDGYLKMADWTAFNNKLSAGATFSGDVSGTITAMQVNKLQGTPVTVTSIAVGDHLKFNGTAWINSALGSVDVTGALGFTPVNVAGDTMTGTLNLPVGGLTVGTNQLFVDPGGNVGIGTSSPSVALDVQGQIHSNPMNVTGTAAVDWNNGNIQYTSDSCQAYSFANVKDGGSYTFAVKGATPAMCTFSSAGLTFHYTPTNGNTNASTHTVYTFFRAGADVYVTWVTGL